MLGTIDQRHLVRLLDALATGDAKGVRPWRQAGHPWPVYAGALADLAVLLSRVAIEQRVTVTRRRRPAGRRYRGWRRPASGRRPAVSIRRRAQPRRADAAPDEYAGFIAACLRMLALNGEAGPQTALEAPAAPARQTAEPPWPRALDPGARGCAHPQAARSKRRLRQPRRLSSRLNAARGQAPPSRRKRPRPRPCPAIRHACRAQPRRNPQAFVVQAAPASRPSLPPRPSPRRKACRLGKSCPMPRLPPTNQARRRRWP